MCGSKPLGSSVKPYTMREAAGCAAEIGRVSRLESKMPLRHAKNRTALQESNTAVRKKSRGMIFSTPCSQRYTRRASIPQKLR